MLVRSRQLQGIFGFLKPHFHVQILYWSWSVDKNDGVCTCMHVPSIHSVHFVQLHADHLRSRWRTLIVRRFRSFLFHPFSRSQKEWKKSASFFTKFSSCHRRPSLPLSIPARVALAVRGATSVRSGIYISGLPLLTSALLLDVVGIHSTFHTVRGLCRIKWSHHIWKPAYRSEESFSDFLSYPLLKYWSDSTLLWALTLGRRGLACRIADTRYSHGGCT